MTLGTLERKSWGIIYLKDPLSLPFLWQGGEIFVIAKWGEGKGEEEGKEKRREQALLPLPLLGRDSTKIQGNSVIVQGRQNLALADWWKRIFGLPSSSILLPSFLLLICLFCAWLANEFGGGGGGRRRGKGFRGEVKDVCLQWRKKSSSFGGIFFCSSSSSSKVDWVEIWLVLLALTGSGMSPGKEEEE